jgi:hypothetical protein
MGEIPPDGQSFATVRGHGKELPRVYNVLLWTMGDGPRLVKQHRITTSGIAISSDLRSFATAEENPDGTAQVALWDMETGQRSWSATFSQHGTHLQLLAFVGNGKVLSARGGGGTSRYDWRWHTTLWDVTSTPKVIGSFAEEPVVSPDGEWLAVPIEAGVLLQRNPARGKRETVRIMGERDPFCVLDGGKVLPRPTFSPDSTMLIVEGLHQERKSPFLGRLLPQRLNPFREVPGGQVVRLWDVRGRRDVQALSDCGQAWVAPDSSAVASLRDGQFIDLWKPPFRNALWRVVGCAINCLLIVVLLCWLVLQAWGGGGSR